METEEDIAFKYTLQIAEATELQRNCA